MKMCAHASPGEEREQTVCAVRHLTRSPLLPAHRRRSARRKAGAILFASAVLSAVALAPATAETLRVGKAGRDAFSFVPADVGARTGIFRQHGVDIEISSFGGDARLQQAMAADGIDVGLGSGPGLAFIVKGSPVKGIAAMAGPPLLFALVVRNDAAVGSLDDLKGRKVGVSTVGSVTSWIISEVSRQKGWGRSRSATTPTGSPRSRPGRSTAPSSTSRKRSISFSAGKAKCCCASATWSRTSIST